MGSVVREMKGREDFLLEIKELKLLVGALVIIWNYSTLKGFFIRWLQYFWQGVKDAPTHIQRVYNRIWDISADTRGVALVDRVEAVQKARRVKIVVHKSYRQPESERCFQKMGIQRLKKPVDGYYYLSFGLKIIIFLIPVALIWAFITDSYLTAALIILFSIICWPIRCFLSNRSGNPCSGAELSNCLDREMGLETGIEVNQCASPLYFHRLATVCQDFEIIYDSGWIE